MAKITFKIAKISPSNGGKTAVLTLTVGMTLFGIENAKRNVYYIGGIDGEAVKKHKVGDDLSEDMENFWQVKRPYYIAERNTWVMCNWLHFKAQYPDGMPIEQLPAEYLKWLEANKPQAATPATAAA